MRVVAAACIFVAVLGCAAWLMTAAAQPPLAARVTEHGERLAAQAEQLKAAQQSLQHLQTIPERMAATEAEIRQAKWFFGLGFGALIGVVLHTGRKLRRTYQRIAHFMGAVEEIPQLKETLESRPCIVRGRCEEHANA